MTKLKHYMQDGAGYQARAVLMFLQAECGEIEESYDREKAYYKALVSVARWENCREQGYIVSVKSEDRTKQLNIAFFEHRNSDNICAVKWEQLGFNSLNISTAEFGNIYKDKYDISHSVGFGEVYKMASWIRQELTAFWNENSKFYTEEQ